jgi:hypothetical protein
MRRTGAAVVPYFRGAPRAISTYRMRQEVRHFVARTPWPAAPPGKLIVIADAFYVHVSRHRLTVYLTLLKEVGTAIAVVTPPTILDGTESYLGWHAHFATLPHSVSRRLIAAVCDGRVGLLAVVRERNLILQRCHFHLIARIQIKRSKWRSSRHFAEGVRLYRLARTVLTARRVGPALTTLIGEARRTDTRALKTILLGLAAHYPDYRAYLRYPRLTLPTTTGSAESLIGSIREMLRRMHGLRTQGALELWLTAYLKYRRTIRCNSQQN